MTKITNSTSWNDPKINGTVWGGRIKVTNRWKQLMWAIVCLSTRIRVSQRGCAAAGVASFKSEARFTLLLIWRRFISVFTSTLRQKNKSRQKHLSTHSCFQTEGSASLSVLWPLLACRQGCLHFQTVCGLLFFFLFVICARLKLRRRWEFLFDESSLSQSPLFSL